MSMGLETKKECSVYLIDGNAKLLYNCFVQKGVSLRRLCYDAKVVKQWTKKVLFLIWTEH